MSKFKIGDKVRLNWTDDYDKVRGHKVGDIFTVMQDSQDSTVPYCRKSDGCVWALYEEQLELVDSPTPETQWNGKVTVDGKEYKIEWTHLRFDLGERNLHKASLYNDYENHPEAHKLRAMSYCWITTNGVIGATDNWGTAFCTMTDNFCYKIGRKLSLDRALHSVFSNSDERRQVWEQVLQYPGLVK